MEKGIILFSKSSQFLSLTKKYIEAHGMRVYSCISEFSQIERLTPEDKDRLFIIKFKENDNVDYEIEYLKENNIKWIVVSSDNMLNFRSISEGAIDQAIIKETPTIAEYKVFINILSKKILRILQDDLNEENILNDKYDKVIVIGASTGGTEAVEKILTELDENMPPILIVLHMPPMFTNKYAQRLDELCKIKVREARHGDVIKSGLALVAPGGHQMRVKKDAFGYVVCCTKEGKFNGHIPSVDILFKSAADNINHKLISVILTGMGSDGAKGSLEIRKKGGYTIGQDKESSIVYGMPKVAYEIGGVLRQASLEQIPKIITELVR